jgi:hypothetical protein
MLRATPLNGLANYEPDDRECWKNWRTWPHLNIAIDQGGDGLAGGHFLEHIGMNLTKWADFSHGSWGDVKKMLADCGLFQWWMLHMIMCNVCHGPNNDDMRYAQVQEAWKEIETTFNAKDNVLFQEHCINIADETDRKNLQADDGDLDTAIWEAMKLDPPLRKKGYKVNLNRFFGGISHTREMIPQWHSRLFQYEHVALECDMMSNSKFVKKLLLPVVPDGDPDARTSTDTNQITISDKALKSCCQNALVISVAHLQQRENNLIARIIVTVTRPVEKWHQEQNTQLRSVHGVREWLLAQLGGGFMAHVGCILESLSNATNLQFCRFSLPGDTSGLALPNNNKDGDIELQNEMADIQGSLCLSLVAARQQRTLWLFAGYPFSLAALMEDNLLAMETLHQFRDNFVAFKFLRDHANPTAEVTSLVERSPFQWTGVKQFTEALPLHPYD